MAETFVAHPDFGRRHTSGNFISYPDNAARGERKIHQPMTNPTTRFMNEMIWVGINDPERHRVIIWQPPSNHRPPNVNGFATAPAQIAFYRLSSEHRGQKPDQNENAERSCEEKIWFHLVAVCRQQAGLNLFPAYDLRRLFRDIPPVSPICNNIFSGAGKPAVTARRFERKPSAVCPGLADSAGHEIQVLS